MIFLIILICIIILYLFYAIIPSRFIKISNDLKRKRTGKVLYLTFDDGPSEYTKDLFNILNKYNIKASFFCVANYANSNKNIIKMIKNNNHLIGLHSLNHENAYLMGINKTNKDFKESINIMNNLNINITYYRPPWGDLNLISLNNINKYDLKLVLWNVMAEDWEYNTSKEIIKDKLLKRIHGNDIICLHDGRGKNDAPFKMIEALDEVIPILLNKGYIFETVDNYYEK